MTSCQKSHYSRHTYTMCFKIACHNISTILMLNTGVFWALNVKHITTYFKSISINIFKYIFTSKFSNLIRSVIVICILFYRTYHKMADRWQSILRNKMKKLVISFYYTFTRTRTNIGACESRQNGSQIPTKLPYTNNLPLDQKQYVWARRKMIKNRFGFPTFYLLLIFLQPMFLQKKYILVHLSFFFCKNIIQYMYFRYMKKI